MTIEIQQRATRLTFSIFVFLAIVSCGPSSPDHATKHRFFEQHGELGFEPPPRQLSNEEIEHLAQFQNVEKMHSLQTQKVLDAYSHLDPKKVVPKKLLKKAVLYFDKNQSLIKNKNYITIVDFKSLSSLARFYLIAMDTGAVVKLHVAHGIGSDQDDDGIAEIFSNTPNSNASSLGYFLTAESYHGANGLSLRIDGLSSTNSNVRDRAIVVHGSYHVYNTDDKPDRSRGCFSIPMIERDKVVEFLKGGSLIYADISG